MQRPACQRASPRHSVSGELRVARGCARCNPESREKALWIIANRSMQAYAENHTGFGNIRKLAIYDDHEITPASKFRVILVGLPTALYYRDLFVHRLGATTADRGSLLLVDGQVMTAFGIFIQDFLQFRTRHLLEMFGITRSSRRYRRLGKLFMLLLTSGEMKKRLCDITEALAARASGHSDHFHHRP